ncbi:hypothetical protein J6G99_04555 [bacterium]|nr:hypothetical protein [bacterium]
MLAIQPVSVSSNYKNPAFKQSWTKQDVEDEIGFIRGQVNEINEFIDDNVVPEKIKKPFKFFRVIANAAIDGLAVFGSAIMLSAFVKKSYGRIVSSKVVTNKINPMMKKGSQAINENLDKAIDKLTKTDLYKKIIKTKIGKEIIGDTAVLTVKAENATKKINIDGNKITQYGAGVLGVGAGITGAYEATIEPEEQYSEYEEVV